MIESDFGHGSPFGGVVHPRHDVIPAERTRILGTDARHETKHNVRVERRSLGRFTCPDDIFDMYSPRQFRGGGRRVLAYYELMPAREEKDPQRCHRGRYEDLVTVPEETAAAIFLSLGVEQNLAHHDRRYRARGDRAERLRQCHRRVTRGLSRGTRYAVSVLLGLAPVPAAPCSNGHGGDHTTHIPARQRSSAPA